MKNYKVEKENKIFDEAYNKIEAYYYFSENEDTTTYLGSGRCKLHCNKLNINWEKRIATLEILNLKTDEFKIFKVSFDLDYNCEITKIFAEQQ